jgi:Zn-dependent protease
VRGSIRIGRILGIPIGINPSWFLLLLLVVITMATQVFPDVFGDEPAWMIWLLTLGTVLVFFASLVAHELGHSLIARYFDIPVRSITLFVLGAVAQTTRESRRASHEFLMAAAGPAVSILLAGLFMVLWFVTGQGGNTFSKICALLWSMNFVVGIFNLVPAYPMDGGRLLRAGLWALLGSYRRATRWAALVARLMAAVLIGLGVLIMLRLPGGFDEYSPLFGVQLVFLGLFINIAARQGDAQSGLLDFLSGYHVADVMLSDVPVEPAYTTVREALAGPLAGYGPAREWLFVSDEGRFAGLAARVALQAVPDDQSLFTRVGQVLIPRERLRAVAPRETLSETLQRMEAEEAPVMMVVEDGEVSGLIHRGLIMNVMNRRRGVAVG